MAALSHNALHTLALHLRRIAPSAQWRCPAERMGLLTPHPRNGGHVVGLFPRHSACVIAGVLLRD